MNGDLVECLEPSPRIHLAIKDVNNDGISEVLIASDPGHLDAMLGVYRMKDGRFQQIAVLSGQHVFEHGHIVMSYGPVGLSWSYVWRDSTFQIKELCDPLRRRSVF